MEAVRACYQRQHSRTLKDKMISFKPGRSFMLSPTVTENEGETEKESEILCLKCRASSHKDSGYREADVLPAP